MPRHLVAASGLECAVGLADVTSSALTNVISRDASYALGPNLAPRYMGGYGIGVRQTGNSTHVLSFTTIYGGSANSPFSAHCCGDIYLARWMIRFRSFPSSEDIFVELGSNVIATCGAISIDNLGDVRLYNYPAGSFTTR